MRRNGIQIMARLIGLVFPLMGWMVLAVLLGVLGYLAAIALTPLAAALLIDLAGYQIGLKWPWLVGLLLFLAAMRGVLRYGEQACNHYIAFRLLARLRHQVFVKLRQLAPARLEGRDKGDLIAMITSDIELLEVFYAHTISPIAIAGLTSGVIVLVLGRFHLLLGGFALLSFLGVGVGLPLIFGRLGAASGMQVRSRIGQLNSFFLDSLRGLRELMQYHAGQKRLTQFMASCEELEKEHFRLKQIEGQNRSLTNAVVMLLSLLMLGLALMLVQDNQLSPASALWCSMLMLGSFGPTVALSSLSNNLHHTLASGERVLSLLEEQPSLEEVHGQSSASFGTVNAEQVCFAYQDEWILKDISLEIPQGKITGILGKSGSGKSTLVRLLMRFWKLDQGEIRIGLRSLEKINTEQLRAMESAMSQETVLFNDTVYENIALVKPQATFEEVREAARKASLAEWIESLPKGYETLVGELGEALSGGERQRIGLARAFLHDAEFFLLDEPTSNLDSLNEAVILRSLKKEARQKTILLVSHRSSTLAIADQVFKMKSNRKS